MCMCVCVSEWVGGYVCVRLWVCVWQLAVLTSSTTLSPLVVCVYAYMLVVCVCTYSSCAGGWVGLSYVVLGGGRWVGIHLCVSVSVSVSVCGA